MSIIWPIVGTMSGQNAGKAFLLFFMAAFWKSLRSWETVAGLPRNLPFALLGNSPPTLAKCEFVLVGFKYIWKRCSDSQAYVCGSHDVFLSLSKLKFSWKKKHSQAQNLEKRASKAITVTLIDYSKRKKLRLKIAIRLFFSARINIANS